MDEKYLNAGPSVGGVISVAGQEISTLTPIRKGKKGTMPGANRAEVDFFSELQIDRDARINGKKVVDISIVTACKNLNYSFVGGKWVTTLRIYLRIKGYSSDPNNLDGYFQDEVKVEAAEQESTSRQTCKPVAIHRFFELKHGLYRADSRILDDKDRFALGVLGFRVED